MQLFHCRPPVSLYAWTFVLAITGTCYAAAESPTVTIVMMEPAESDLGYTLVQGGMNAGTMGKIMDVLSRNYSGGGKLAVLFHSDVPVRSLTTISSLANKVGFRDADIKLIAFDAKRKGMIELTIGSQFVTYSADPDVLEGYFMK